LVFFGNRYGQVSRSQWIEKVRIRRLTGDRPFPSSLFVTQPYRSHDLSRALRGPTRAAVYLSFRRRRF
jgi:hypothetical protein